MEGRAIASGEGVRVLHPDGNVALAVEYAPDIDVVRSFDVEDEVGVGRQRPGAQARKVQLMPIARRARARIVGDVGIALFQCVDEAERNR